MPLYTYECPKCKIQKDKIKSYEERDMPEICTKCNILVDRMTTAHGGYMVRGDNSASRTPRGSGSFRGKK